MSNMMDEMSLRYKLAFYTRLRLITLMPKIIKHHIVGQTIKAIRETH